MTNLQVIFVLLIGGLFGQTLAIRREGCVERIFARVRPTKPIGAGLVEWSERIQRVRPNLMEQALLVVFRDPSARLVSFHERGVSKEEMNSLDLECRQLMIDIRPQIEFLVTCEDDKRQLEDPKYVIRTISSFISSLPKNVANYIRTCSILLKDLEWLGLLWWFRQCGLMSFARRQR